MKIENVEIPTKDILVWLKTLAKMKLEYLEKYRDFVVGEEKVWSDIGVSFLPEVHLSNIEILAKGLKDENLIEVRVFPFDFERSSTKSELKFSMDGVTFFGLSDMTVEEVEEFLNE